MAEGCGLCWQGCEDRSEPLLVGGESRNLFQEAERLALDRAVACHLLQVVYDASPLVRVEVALALSRIVTGHSILFQVWLAPSSTRSCRGCILGRGRWLICMVSVLEIVVVQGAKSVL